MCRSGSKLKILYVFDSFEGWMRWWKKTLSVWDEIEAYKASFQFRDLCLIFSLSYICIVYINSSSCSPEMFCCCFANDDKILNLQAIKINFSFYSSFFPPSRLDPASKLFRYAWQPNVVASETNASRFLQGHMCGLNSWRCVLSTLA